jgi:hypothetical protein
MAVKSKPKLTDKQWRALQPQCRKAAKHTASAVKSWAKVAADAVNGNPHADWRWLLADLRNRCVDSGIDCSYTPTYLIQLAETYAAVEGDLERDVPVSVLVEGRNLDNLLDIVEEEKEDLTVARIKAHVYKDANDDDRDVDEIEADLRDKRDTVKERKTRKRHAEKIEGWSLDKSDNLLPTLKDEITSYRSAILRHHEEGQTFDPTEVALALDAVNQLAATLESIRPVAVRAA